MKRSLFVGLLLCSAVLVSGQTTNHISTEELRRLRLPDVLLESVEPSAADLQKNAQAKGYTRVEGVIGGNNRFELLLPDDWNGRFVMGGGGGFVGSVQNAARGSVNRGYATVGTD